MEFNRESLEKAKASLPKYTPPSFVWEHIESAIEQEASNEVLQNAIKALPVYQPPGEIWTNVDQAIGQHHQLQIRYKWSKRLAIAASILIVAAIVGLNPWDSQPTVTYSESVETVQPLLIDWEADAEQISLLVDEFDNSFAAKQSSTYIQWKTEMDELVEARAELVDAIQLYGEDDQLIQELNKIDDAITTLGNKMYKLI